MSSEAFEPRDRRSRGAARAPVLRVLAVVLVAWSLWALRGSDEQPSVVVLALEGFRPDLATAVAADADVPLLRDLLSRSIVASLEGPGEASAGRVWNDILAGGIVPAAAQAGVKGAIAHLAVELDRLPEGWTVLPGPQPTSGFLGDDSGWIGPVIGEDTEAPPWPYAEAAGVIADWASRLPRGRSSPWLEIRVGDRSGVFRVYRADDVRAYLTPVYLRSWPATAWNTSAPERLYVAEEPGWAGPSGEGGDEWVLRHLLDLVQERAQAVAAAAAGSRLIVYGEDFLARVDCGTGCPRDQDGQLVATAEVRRAYRTLEEVLESFRAALPGPAVTVLLGAGGGPDWFRQVSSADRPLGVAVVAARRPTGPATVTASLDDVRATLLDLLDVRAEPGCGRVFTRLEAAGSGTFGPACGSERGETWQPLDVHELVEAGQAPGAD